MFIHYKTSSPCPLCRGVTDCRQNSLTNLTHCRRTDKDYPPAGWRYIKDDSIGFGMFSPEGSEPGGMSPQAEQQISEARRIRGEQRTAKKEAAATRSRFDEIRSRLRPMDAAERDAISSHLSLPVGTPGHYLFDYLDVQICPDDGYGRMSWAFPERNAAGQVIGYTLRYADDSKRAHGNRGLYIPSQRSNALPTSPIYLVEGASGTLAMIALGLNVIGRPNDRAGVDMLANLLQGVNRPLIVVGDNDENGAGRSGAEAVAGKLAAAIRRPVYVAMPPAGIKDSRELIVARAAAIRAGETTLAAIGQEYAEHLAAAAVVFGVEPTPTPATPPPAAVTFAPIQSPPLDTTPRTDPAAEIKRCPTPKGVYMRDNLAGYNSPQFFDCKRLSCPYCAGLKKQQYQATIQTHLEAHARNNPDSPTVHVFFTTEKGWDTVSRSFRGRDDGRAKYFRLDYDGFILVVSATSPPKSKHVTQHEEVTADAASSKMCLAIERLYTLKEKKFSTSKAWKLVGEEKRKEPGRWKRIGKISASKTKVWEILEYHKVSFTPMTTRGMFWGWEAWRFYDAQATLHGHQAVIDDILAGEILPSDAQIDALFGGPIDATDQELVPTGSIGDDGNFW